MEVRKIIAFGKSSYVITLPKDWLSTNNLEKGDVVFLNQSDDNLIVGSKEKETIREETRQVIDTEGKTVERVKREVASAFINYNNYIVVQGRNLAEYSKEIADFIHNLIALEIMEQSSNKLVAQDFLRAEDTQIKDYVRKSDIIIRSMLTDLKDQKFKLYSDLVHRHKNVDRIYLLLLKTIKAISKDPSLIKKLDLTSEELLTYNKYN